MTVTRPADTVVTSRPVPKLIVCAVPTGEPVSLTPIPDPVPVTLVSPEPSPIKLSAVETPDTVIPPLILI